MRKIKRATKGLIAGLLLTVVIYFVATNFNINPTYQVGDIVDEFNGVKVYYNGSINNTVGRNTSNDGYNIGLRYQCVEFVKRYYLERFGHKMPETRGHAKDFFDKKLRSGQLNTNRNLIQYYNGSTEKPSVDDLLVFSPWLFNRYGHVAIVSKVTSSSIEVIQQNPGAFGSSRESYKLTHTNGAWKVESNRLLGWLRLPAKRTNNSLNLTP